MPLISIIVPVYNCEKYLSKCLDSIINQTHKDLEVICVNDGSTDNSSKILKDYSEKDSRIIVINQENQKQGTARNKGLEIAKGEYITFVDSDDWIDLDYCEKLYKACIEFNVNVAAASMIREKKNRRRNHLKLQSKETYYGAADIIKGIDEHLETAGKLYKFEYIKDLRFIEEILYEDAPYTIRAIKQCNSLVTVPDTTYHYFSNPKSTIKTKQDEKKRNDIIETQLNILKYAEENNIKLNKNFVVKDEFFPFKIKHFKERREYYFLGIKFFTKYVPFNEQKTFVILILAAFGDVLLCNSLVQNIKTQYPNSKVIFIVNKPYADAAKYQKGVDEVYAFDKKGENKGIIGNLKFALKFPYKRMDYLLRIHKTARIKILSFFLNPKMLFDCKFYENLSVQERNSNLLLDITHKKIHNYPIKYLADETLIQKFQDIFQENKNYIALCTTTARKPKDMPIETAVDLINKLNHNNYSVILTGAGRSAELYAQELLKQGCNFTNLVNKTTIPELAAVLKNCKSLISVDTGTMHFGYANDVPTVCVFYVKELLYLWTPRENLYKVKVITENQTVENIYKQLEGLINAK